MRHCEKRVYPLTVANAPTAGCALTFCYNQAVDAVREVRVVVSHPFYNGEKLVTDRRAMIVGTFTYLDSSFDVEMGGHTPGI